MTADIQGGADARTEAAARQRWDGRLHQRAYLIHRVVLEWWYYQGPGDGTAEKDWTEEKDRAETMDFIDAQRMADRLGHGYHPALVTATADSGRHFFALTHHDREAETEHSLRAAGMDRVQIGRQALPPGDRE